MGGGTGGARRRRLESSARRRDREEERERKKESMGALRNDPCDPNDRGEGRDYEISKIRETRWNRWIRGSIRNISSSFRREEREREREYKGERVRVVVEVTSALKRKYEP